MIATLLLSAAMTVQCGGCAVTGNANQRGTPLSVYPPLVLVAVYSNYTAKTVRSDCKERMKLAILFLCILFPLLYVSGVVLIVRIAWLSSYRSAASAKRAGGRAHRVNESHSESDLL